MLIKTSMLFILVFANNTISTCFFFWIIQVLSPVVIAQIFNPITEVVIPLGIGTKKAKAEIEIHQVNGEAKIRKCSI